MPDIVTPDATAQPIPVQTQSAQNTEQLQPPTPQVGTGSAQPQMPLPEAPTQHQSWFSTMAHAVAGAVLGTVAARDKEIAPPEIDANGNMMPAVTTRATTGDQLRQIARSALQGLAAGARAPRQKSGFATAMGGLGAGAEDAVARQQLDEDQAKKDANEDFNRRQQLLLNKANNAHIAIETAKMVQDLRHTTFDTQSKVAAMGKDQLDAAMVSGNVAPVQDLHQNEILKYMEEHKEFSDYTPILTKVLPQDGAMPDPKTGEVPVDRYYSLVDLDKPVPLTASMVNHLKAVNWPGSESLTPGMEVPGKSFAGLWYQGLKAYNEASMDSKNKKIEEVSDDKGNTTKVMVNALTGAVQKLTDPDTGKPLQGKVETSFRDIYDPQSQSTGTWVVADRSGKKLAYVGPAKSDMSAPVGDYSLSGEDFIQTLPPPMRDTVKAISNYNIAPEALGRSQDRKNYIDAAVHYDPTFNERNYKLRYDFMRKWQAGQLGNGRLNTALGHLDMLDKAANALAKNDIRFFNAVANEFGYQTGLSPKVAYDTIARKAAGEAAGAIKGGASAATEPEIESVFSNFSSSNSPKQQHAAIGSNIALIKTQAETLENQFAQAMGKTPESAGQPVVYPQNQPILARWGLATHAAPAAQAAPTPPGVPANASHVYKDTNGAVVGYALDGKYVPIGKQ